MPSFPAGQSTIAPTALRFEDVTQHGHLLPIAMPPGLGPLWREVVVPHTGTRNAIASGVIPIMTRLTMVAHDIPVRADKPAEVHAGFVLAHDGDGEADRRLYFNAWVELRAAAGKLSQHARAGELVPAGALFAEHTFTRLLAPPEKRKVTRLAVDGMPEVPALRYAAPRPDTAREAPEGASWLDELAPDSSEHCFTFDQTDSNQHVNSLVYIRIFLDAVNRRLAATGRSLNTRSRAVDIAYRKPCFAGDRVRAQLRLFDRAGQLGAAGFVEGSDAKPRCFVRAVLAA
jgi:hypothetical protein